MVCTPHESLRSNVYDHDGIVAFCRHLPSAVPRERGKESSFCPLHPTWSSALLRRKAGCAFHGLTFSFLASA
jgi:hypothetical protein